MSKKNKIKLTENDKKVSKIITVDRVVKVTKGGRDFSYRALVVVGNQEGILGYGVGKSKDLSESVSKGEENALKNLLRLSFVRKSIPHEMEAYYSGARVFIRPATPGTGLIAGGAIRSVLEVAGLRNILSKCKGSSNPHNVVKATLNALLKMRDIKTISKERGFSIRNFLNS